MPPRRLPVSLPRDIGGLLMLQFADGPVVVRSPATSANLGPGFDSFGLALGLHDFVEAVAVPHGLDIQVQGEGAADVDRGEEHLVAKAMRATFDAFGLPQPGLRLRCRNAIPHGRGLGSSAAAIGAGIRLAEGLAAGPVLDPGRALNVAASLEGHPDNVAACLFGGFTVAWSDSLGEGVAARFAAGVAGGSSCALRLEVHPDIRPVLCIPPGPLSTRVARDLLPSSVSHEHARATAARAGLLVAALTSYPQHLTAATQDWLHQEHRRTAMPDTLSLVDALRGAGIAAVVSGAGPAVLVLSTGETRLELTRWAPPTWRVLELTVDPVGATRLRGAVLTE